MASPDERGERQQREMNQRMALHQSINIAFAGIVIGFAMLLAYGPVAGAVAFLICCSASVVDILVLLKSPFYREK